MADAQPDERNLPDPAEAVTVAYVYGDGEQRVSYSWHHSMVELIGYDLANSGRVLAGGYIAMRCGADGLVEGRNRSVRHFLEDTKADWLFWVDTDMGFEPDIIDRLLDAADPETRPVVGALCFSQRELADDGAGGWRCSATPTVFDWATVNVYDDATVNGQQRRTKVGEQQGFAVRWDYPANTLTQVGGTGMAAILIHRGVFERLEAKYGRVWYDRVPNTTTGQIVSEDLSFCLRAGALGIPIHVHTGVRTTHHKSVWLGEEDYWRQRALEPPPPPLPTRQDAERAEVVG